MRDNRGRPATLRGPRPGSNWYPVADVRCGTCVHRYRGLIEALLDGGTSPSAVAGILRDRGEPTPGRDSIRNHRDKHRASPAVVRRVQHEMELLDQMAQLNREFDARWAEVEARRQQEVAESPPYILQVPAGSPASQLPVPA